MTHDWCCAIYACKKGICNNKYYMIVLWLFLMFSLKSLCWELLLSWLFNSKFGSPVLLLRLSALVLVWLHRYPGHGAFKRFKFLPNEQLSKPILTLVICLVTDLVYLYWCCHPSNFFFCLFQLSRFWGSWSITRMCRLLVLFQLWNSSLEVLEALVSLLCHCYWCPAWRAVCARGRLCGLVVRCGKNWVSQSVSLGIAKTIYVYTNKIVCVCMWPSEKWK